MKTARFWAAAGLKRCIELKRIAFVTLGCKVNQYDSGAVMEMLPKEEFEIVPHTDLADFYVINTCTVTHKADAEARNFINRARRANPDGVVIVTGCYAQVSPEELAKESNVDYVLGNADKFMIKEIIDQGERQTEPRVIVSDVFRQGRFETPEVASFTDRTRAYLKIQDGCNYRCSFCIIPYARGRSRSLPLPEVITRLRVLADAGHKEAVLTGIHLASYGRDIGTGLMELLEELERLKIVPRIRLSSLDPADFSDEFIDFIATSKTVCPSFHIALQSGDSEILKKMRRRYKPTDFLYYTDRIREKIPNAAIGTDVMVGFPGETDEYFENTYEVLERSALTYFHVFPYSKRRGTPAADMPGHLEPDILKLRSKRLRELGREKKEAFYRSFIGEKLRVLVERGSRGTTDNYISVRILNGNHNVGDEVDVKLFGVENETALGNTVQ